MFYIFYSTMLINLKKSELELWNQIKYSRRKCVNKFCKLWYEVIHNPSISDLRYALDLYLSLQKKLLVPVDRNFKLVVDDKYKILIIKVDNKILWFLKIALFSNFDKLWKSKMCTFDAIWVNEEFFHLSPQALLYWEWFKFMKSLSYEYINLAWVEYSYWDFKLTNTVAFFKRSWHWIEIECVSKKSFIWYIYWRFFRKFTFVKKVVYFLLVNIFRSRFLKY